MGIFSKQRRIVVNNRYTHASSMRNGGVMFRLTLKKLIILAIILLLLLVWAFFVGVLVGQEVSTADKAGASAGLTNSTGSYVVDENTPPALPDVAQAPRVEKTPTPPPVSPQAQSAPNAAKGTADKNTTDGSGEAVISPQELSFMSDLKDKPAPPDAASATGTAPQRSAQQQAATSANTQNTQRATADADAGRPEDPAPKATTPPGPGIFDYQYQVAATTDLEGAKRLVGQLRAEGLRASMVQGNKDGSKLYRVHVDFRGTPSDTNQLREQLSKFGINRVLLKTKVATQ